MHLADGLLEAVRGEDDQEPSVDDGQQVGFAEVDVAGGSGSGSREPGCCTGLASGVRSTRSTAALAAVGVSEPAGALRGWYAGRARRQP